MARTVTAELDVVQNLIHLHLLESSLGHKNIAAEVTDAIEKKMKLPRVCTVYVESCCKLVSSLSFCLLIFCFEVFPVSRAFKWDA